jgi:hypothetical protein
MKTTPQRPALFLTATLLAAALAASPLPAQPGVRNGDVNGSGQMDISDVIALAAFLFQGGPAPVPLVCPAPVGEEEGVPAFDGGLYRPLDLQAAAAEQYGPLARLIEDGDHLYDWKVRVGREIHGLDLARAVADQYGSGYRLVMTGVHKYDWKAFRAAEPDHVVLPVLIVAAEHFYDIEGVRRALDRYRSVLGRVQTWYRARTGAELRMLEPLIARSDLTGAQWDFLSASTAQEAHRYDLLEQSVAAYEAELPAPGDNLRVVIAQYTGESAGIWLGAAASGRYAVAPPRAASLDCPEAGDLDAACSDAAYAIGHELGHTFGLGHTCDDYPEFGNCAASIMHTGKPPQAILTPPEVCALRDSPFFHPLAPAAAGAAIEIAPRPRDAE